MAERLSTISPSQDVEDTPDHFESPADILKTESVNRLTFSLEYLRMLIHFLALFGDEKRNLVIPIEKAKSKCTLMGITKDQITALDQAIMNIFHYGK